jgi:hypothetical protein
MSNIISSAVIRGIWLIKNDFIFNNQVWSDVKVIWRRIRVLSLEWSILCKDQKKEEMKN